MDTKLSNQDVDLVWALDVLEVYRLGGKSPSNDASASVKDLYEWSLNPENKDKLMITMVPKATDIVAKHRSKETPDVIVQIENRGIAELQTFLKAAIEESQI